jgi:hypothetical protein
MDSSITIKPRDSVSRVLHDRKSVARTELSPNQSVTAANLLSPGHDGRAASEFMGRGPTIDPRSDEALRHAREEEERRKRKRAADEALSRMRAYRQPEPHTESEPEPPRADIEV